MDNGNGPPAHMHSKPCSGWETEYLFGVALGAGSGCAYVHARISCQLSSHSKKITYWLYFAMQLDSSRPGHVSQDTAGLVQETSQDLMRGGGIMAFIPTEKKLRCQLETHTPLGTAHNLLRIIYDTVTHKRNSKPDVVDIVSLHFSLPSLRNSHE